MEEYVKINKRAYDRLAPQYNQHYGEHKEVYLAANLNGGDMPAFMMYLSRSFKKIRIIDVGCGVGTALYEMKGGGYELYGLDISRKMIGYARKNLPGIKFICGDFLTKRIDMKFEGVVLGAFIHLFPKKDIDRVLGKVASIMVKGGYCFLFTTKSKNSGEGFFEKNLYSLGERKSTRYAGREIRFRKYWTEPELRETLKNNREFRLVYFNLFKDPISPERTWIQAILKKVN